jgi:glycerol-3-phosphate cytidylyltransferase/D-beta-D-heptose 7-phosphate kinase/D-beta-D-heptose 1-phosphate adenosyltransferase
MEKEKKRKKIVVAVSGYFTVLHKGHIVHFEEAKKLGNYLVVILNNERQQIAKKGKLIHRIEDIKYILERLGMVDEVFISIDEDGSVCKSLEAVMPDIYAKGGDRTAENIPEVEACKRLGIKVIYNVGGGKYDSSSRLIKEEGL